LKPLRADLVRLGVTGQDRRSQHPPYLSRELVAVSGVEWVDLLLQQMSPLGSR